MNKTLTTLVVLATVASFAVAAPAHKPTQDQDKMKMGMMMDMGMTISSSTELSVHPVVDFDVSAAT